MRLIQPLCLAAIALLHGVSCAWAGAKDFESAPIVDTDFSKGIPLDIWHPAIRPGVGWPNNEEQYYVPQALKTDKDGLHIIAKREQTTVNWRPEPFEFTAGELVSYQPFLYGRFEFVAKLPKGKSFWPALWLRAGKQDPALPLRAGNGEIDVIEAFGSDSHAVQSTLLYFWADNGDVKHHTEKQCAIIGVEKAKKKPWCVDANATLGYKTPDLSADYHTYGLEWLPDHITWLFDGKPYYTFSGSPEVPITHDPMWLVINFVIGGMWDGSPDASTPFPASFDVKYVKVWPMKNPPASPVSAAAHD